MLKQIIVTIASVFILAGSAFATSNQINYEGKAEAAENRSHNVVFAIYRTQSGGTPIWQEIHRGVQVTDGRFQAIIGSISPIPDSVRNGTIWLETKVDGVVSERKPIFYDPKTQSLVWSEGGKNVVSTVVAGSGLTGGGATESVTLDVGAGAGIQVTANDVAIADGGVTEAKLANNAVTSAKIKDDEVSSADIKDGTIQQADMAFTAGDITAVNAGNGLTGGGTSGDVTLDVGAGAGIQVTTDAVAFDQTWGDNRYINAGESVSDADKVDGFHASSSGGNNTILPLDSYGRFTVPVSSVVFLTDLDIWKWQFIH